MNKPLFLTMQKAFFILLFLLPAIILFGQMKVPVFESKKDSAGFEEINRQLMDIRQFDASALDSLMMARHKLMERAIRFRTIYVPTRWFAQYGHLPKDLSTVTKMSVSDYAGMSIPDSVYFCTNLKELELVNTRIKRLPKELAALRSLEKVTLLNNRPKGRLRLARNKTIETLVINDDEFNKFPRNYRKLTGLKSLDLSRNNLSSFPRLRGARSLRRLLLADNLLTEDDLNQRLPLLEDLGLAANSLKKVPPSIAGFAGLKKLNLSANQIESIAPEIGKLQNLEFLSFYKNRLQSIPTELFDLKNLRNVDLYYNQMKDLDSRIGNWSKLEILYVANNQLLRLPDELCQLTSLRELYVHHNRLTTLPEALGRLDTLRVLRVNNNFLVELPKALYSMKTLENLDVSDNQIQTFEEQLFTLPQLKILSLQNNTVDPSTKATMILWAQKAMQQRPVVIHLEGAGVTSTN